MDHEQIQVVHRVMILGTLGQLFLMMPYYQKVNGLFFLPIQTLVLCVQRHKKFEWAKTKRKDSYQDIFCVPKILVALWHLPPFGTNIDIKIELQP